MTRGHETGGRRVTGRAIAALGIRPENIFNQHPYLGTGYGTYPEGLEGGHFHNVFIELLVTTGMVGTLFYAAFLAVLFVTAKKAIRRTSLKVVATSSLRLTWWRFLS